jgi:hypothetical protein
VGDGGFVRIGKTLARLAQPASAIGQALLDKGVAQIPLHQIPEYFARDLVLLKQEFSAVLTDLAKQSKVADGPAQPVVQVHKTPAGWLEFTVDYRVGDLIWAHQQLLGSAGARYQRLTPTTWAKTNPKLLADVQNQLTALGAQPTPGGCRLPVAQFASLEEFISAQRTQGIKALNAAHRVALSGTPIENRPAELWSLFDFLLRDHLGRGRACR